MVNNCNVKIGQNNQDYDFSHNRAAQLLCVIQSMGERSEMGVHIIGMNSKLFKVGVGHRQGCVLSQDVVKVGDLTCRDNSWYLLMTCFLGTNQTFFDTLHKV